MERKLFNIRATDGTRHVISVLEVGMSINGLNLAKFGPFSTAAQNDFIKALQYVNDGAVQPLWRRVAGTKYPMPTDILCLGIDAEQPWAPFAVRKRPDGVYATGDGEVLHNTITHWAPWPVW